MESTSAKIIVQPNFLDLIFKLFQSLTTREKDILQRRFALSGEETTSKDTLEEIGKSYNITRERVRQIEVEGIKKLKELGAKDPEYAQIKEIETRIEEFLKSHGGAMSHDYLVKKVIDFFSHPDIKLDAKTLQQNKDALSFILTQLLGNKFEKVEHKDKYHPTWKLKETPWEVVEAVIEKLIEVMDTAQKPVLREELIKFLKEKGHFDVLKNTLEEKLAHIKHTFIDAEELFLSFLHISKKVKSNIYNEWGKIDWATVTPKKINDKIYMVMKKGGRPLHFREITEVINQAGFDPKPACAATVHNELILDKKYVLVGRGMYALREWGFRNGTVSEIIAQVLKEKGPLTKTEIFDEVIRQRLIKRATIQLALMNKKLFQETGDGHYVLREQVVASDEVKV